MKVLVKEWGFSSTPKMVTSRQGYLFHILKCNQCSGRGHSYSLKSGNWRGGYRKCRSCFRGDVLFYSQNGTGFQMELDLYVPAVSNREKIRRKKWRKKKK